MDLMNAQRREARRQRVLNNQKARLQKILCAEGEERAEPGLEDGPFNAMPTDCSKSGITSGPATEKEKSVADEKVIRWNHIASPQTPYYKRYRLYAAIIIGALTALLLDTYNAYDANIMVPWFIYEGTIELLMYLFAYSAYRVASLPSHGHVVNALQAFGFNERLIVFGGRAAEMLRRMFEDSILMLISLLISDCLFKVFVDPN